MKKILLACVLVIAFTACAPVAAQLVELPAEQKVAIDGIFVAGFALLLDFIIGRAAWLEFFRQYQEAWALAASTLFISWLENLLPTESEAIAIPGVALVIAVALYLLARTAFRRRGFKAFQ